MSDDEIKNSQINIEKGNSTKFVLPYLGNLSYNEWHSMILGSSFGIISGLIFVFGSQVISLIFISYLSLIITGANLFENVIKPYAFYYTIRSEPWYYLSTLVVLYTIIIVFTMFL